MKSLYEKSQSLPVSINLTEGQLGTDEKIAFYVKEAVVNNLISIWDPKQRSVGE